MATTRPSPANARVRQPLIVVATIAALSGASALPLTRVFANRSWLVVVVAAAVLPHGIGALLARRRVGGGATLAAWTATAVWFTIVAVEPSKTWLGLPTPAAVGAWWADLRGAPDILRSATTPVDPRGGALLLALLAVWAASAAAHWSATRLDGRFGAIMPTLALFVAVSALGDGDHSITTGLYGAATAGFLLAQQQVALADRRSWFHVRPPRRSRLAAGGMAMIVAVAVVGTVVGPRLPSAESVGLLDYQNWGEGRGGPGAVRIVSPLVNIGDALNQSPPAEVFAVRSSVGTYWRLAALDDFDGTVWGLRDTKARPGYVAPEFDGSVQQVRQEFEMGPYRGPFLPAAFQAIDTRFLPAEYSIHESSTLFLESDDYDGLAYQVESVVPLPTPAQLAAIPPADTERFGESLALPREFPDDVRSLARTIVAEASTPFDQAIALQAFFRDDGRFAYDTSVRGHDDDALRRFVLEDRRGFCEQFAGSYAAMARAVGLPSRVAIGFTAGRLERDGRYHVDTDNAHAWPEIYFEGIGWTRFEPTPGRFEPTSTDYTGTGAEDPNPPPTRPGATTTTTADPTATTDPNAGTTPTTVAFRDPDRGVAAGDGTNGDAATSAWRRGLTGTTIVVATVAAFAGSVVVAGFAGAALRRRRRHRASDARGRVLGAWAQALERLGEAGITRRPSATPVEFAMREAPALGAGPAGPPLLALARLQTAAAYAASAPSDEAADDAWNHVVAIEQALTATTRRAVRWRRRLWRR